MTVHNDKKLYSCIQKIESNALSEIELGQIINALCANPNDLRGVFNVALHFNKVIPLLNQLVIDRDKDILVKQSILVKKFILLKPFFLNDSDEFYISEKDKNYRLHKLYGTNTTYVSWFHGTENSEDLYDLLLVHQHLFFLSDTNVKAKTEEKWSTYLRALGENENAQMLEDLLRELNGQINAAAIFDAIEKLLKNSDYLDNEVLTYIRYLFRAAKNKGGQGKGVDQKRNSNGSKIGNKRKIRGARFNSDNKFDLNRFSDYDLTENIGVYSLHNVLKGLANEADNDDSKLLSNSDLNDVNAILTHYSFGRTSSLEINKACKGLGTSKDEHDVGEKIRASDKTGIRTGCYSMAEYITRSKLKNIAITRKSALSLNAYDNLHRKDISVLKEFIFSQLENCVEDNEIAAQLKMVIDLLLNTGRNIENLVDIKCVQSPPSHDKAIVYPLFIPSEGTIYFPAIFEEHCSAGKKDSIDAAQPIANNFPLILPKRIACLLNDMCLDGGEIPTKKARRIFNANFTKGQVSSAIKKIFNDANRRFGTSLSILRVQEILYRAAAFDPNVGRLRACYMTGEIDSVVSVHATYVSISVKSLLDDYSNTLKALNFIGQDEILYGHLNNTYEDLFIGSRITPKLETMIALVKNLKPNMLKKGVTDKLSKERFDRELMIYTGYWLAFESNYRVAKSFFPNDHDIDLNQGLGVISEKDFKEQIHSRGIGFTEGCKEQYLAYISSKENPETSYDANTFSFFNQQLIYIPNRQRVKEVADRAKQSSRFKFIANGKLVDFNLTHFKKFTEDVFPLPANAHRHFIASMAQEKRYPVEFGMALLGHVSSSLGVWMPTSRYRFPQFINESREFMSKINKVVGLEVINNER